MTPAESSSQEPSKDYYEYCSATVATVERLLVYQGESPAPAGLLSLCSPPARTVALPLL